MRKWWRYPAAAMVAGVLACSVAAPAFAQDVTAVSEGAKQLARKNYKAAEAKFAAGDYAGALGLYEQAEATIPVPQTKYKIAACNDRLGRTGEATRWYQRFLDSIPPDKVEKLAAEAADARGRLATLNAATPAQVRLVFSPGTARVLVSVDGSPPQYVGSAIGLPRGHHRLVFQADGFETAVSEIDIANSDAKEIRLALRPRAAVVAVLPPQARPIVVQPVPNYGPVAPVPDAAPRRSNVPAYVLISVGAAGLVVGAAFGGVALQDKSNFNAHPTSSGADSEHTHAQIADVMFAAGGVVALTGIVLLVTNLPRRTQVGQTFITPYAGPTGAGATAKLRF